MLDLAHINLGAANIFATALKRDAQAEAKRRNWNHWDVVQASNRFNIFWVIGEPVPGTEINTWRLAAKDTSAARTVNVTMKPQPLI